MADSKNPPAAAAPDDVKTGEVVPYARVRKFDSYMRQPAPTENKDRAADIEDQQVQRLLDAETDEEIWDADQGGTFQGKDCVGLEIQVNSLTVVLSKREDIVSRQGYYISADAVCLGGPAEVLKSLGLSVGEQFVFQTGAPLIVTKLRAFEARGRLPVKGVVTGLKTGTDNTLLKLRPLPVRAI